MLCDYGLPIWHPVVEAEIGLTPRFWVLALTLAVIVGVSVFLHHNLMSNLKPGEYMNLFANLIQTRLILYYLLAAECLYWYYQALNELKRECVLEKRLATRGWGN